MRHFYRFVVRDIVSVSFYEFVFRYCNCIVKSEIYVWTKLFA